MIQSLQSNDPFEWIVLCISCISCIMLAIILIRIIYVVFTRWVRYCTEVESSRKNEKKKPLLNLEQYDDITIL
jgi:energy-converting hydrogenase Eha subunit H